MKGPEGLWIIPGGSGIEELANVEPFLLNKVLQDVSLLDKKIDYLIIDTGAGISRQVVAVTLAATEVLLVTTPEPTALTDAYGLIKVLKGHLNGGIKLIINMVKNKDEGEAAALKLMRVSKQFLDLTVDFGVWYPMTILFRMLLGTTNPIFWLIQIPAALSTWRIASSLGRIELKTLQGCGALSGR